jgi:mRNA interferase RelE/StbE
VSWAYSFEASALKELKKLGPQAAREILGFLDERMASTEDPRTFGKPLKGDLKGLWRYRVADYRLICSIQDQRLVVLVLKVGHRRDIYD